VADELTVLPGVEELLALEQVRRATEDGPWEVVVVDCGLMFPDEEMFGVDIVINDFTYLRERQDKLRALLVTHGHEDHIGGIPYLLREFPKLPVVGTPLSLALIRAKLKEHKPGEWDARSVEPGDRVMLHLQNVPQFVIGLLAIWKLGAVAVPTNPMLRAEELRKLIDDCRPVVLIGTDVDHEPVYRIAVAGSSVRAVVTTSPLDLLGGETPAPLTGLTRAPADDCFDLLTLIRDAGDDRPPAPGLDPDDLAVLIYTSGTTGPSKGALLSHRNLLATSSSFGSLIEVNDGDSILALAPIFHITGLILHVMLSFVAGIPLILFNRFDGATTLELIAARRPTFTIAAIILVPGFFALIIGAAMFKRRVGGVYFAIITQAIAAILSILIIGQQGYTGGVNGITDLRTLWGWDIRTDHAKFILYFFEVFMLFGVILLTQFIRLTKLGRILVAMREQEDRVRFSGYSVANFKIFAFCMAAIFAAIGGAMFTLEVGFMSPSFVGIVPSIEMVIYTAVGGRMSIFGAVYGTILVNFAKTSLSESFPQLWLFGLGALFIAVVLAFPNGLAGIWGDYVQPRIDRLLSSRKSGWSDSSVADGAPAE